MPWLVAAVVLLLVQHFVGCGPGVPSSADRAQPPPVAALVGEANSTPDALDLTGRVADAAPTYADGVRLTVDVETAGGAPATGLVSVSLRETSRRWRTGDRVSLSSRLRRVAGFGNFGELDWTAYNARRGVYVTAYAWEDGDVVRLEPRDGLADSLRRRFSEACEGVGGQGAEILEALVIGDRTGIDRATADAVRDAGLAHFLAISGSHMVSGSSPSAASSRRSGRRRVHRPRTPAAADRSTPCASTAARPTRRADTSVLRHPHCRRERRSAAMRPPGQARHGTGPDARSEVESAQPAARRARAARTRWPRCRHASGGAACREAFRREAARAVRRPRGDDPCNGTVAPVRCDPSLAQRLRRAGCSRRALHRAEAGTRRGRQWQPAGRIW